MTDLLRRWGPVAIWAVFIFALSSIPALGTGLGTWDLVLRKAAHLAEYAILAALLARALGHEVAAFAAAVAYAVTDEVHQSFVAGRAGKPLDVAIDAAGAALGILLWRKLRSSGWSVRRT